MNFWEVDTISIEKCERWDGSIPEPKTRQEIAELLAGSLRERELLDSQIERVIDLFVEYEKIYADVESNGKIRTFHRICGGSIFFENGTYFCKECGPLPDVIARPKL